MRTPLLKSVLALSVVFSATGAWADSDGSSGGPVGRPGQQQPYVDTDEGYDQGYDQPVEQPYVQQQPQMQNNVVIQNQGYQFSPGAAYLFAGRGLPNNFVCQSCIVNVFGPMADIIAVSPYGAYRIWQGPRGCNNVNLIQTVNQIKVQTGMCGNLPFLPVQPCVYGGAPPVLPPGGGCFNGGCGGGGIRPPYIPGGGGGYPAPVYGPGGGGYAPGGGPLF
ncbi:MAG: hypothetical protein KF799_01305 [Bdellovibrionales bacterium]|nr:hypothetical protein [Bdellovibrionales bacterium]